MPVGPAASTIEPAFAPNFARQHGAAWFALPAQGTRDPHAVGGWAALGGEPAFAFKHWSELPADVVWWTNLSRPEVWSLGQWSRFKEGALLGPEWVLLMNEQGQSLHPDAWADGVRRSSELLARLGEWLSAWSSEYVPEKPWQWGQGSLSDGLAERWGWAQGEQETPQPILQAAYAEEVLQEVPAQSLMGRRRVWFALPRLPLVRQLWRLRFPQGPWTPLQPQEWPETHAGRITWLEQQRMPLLVQVDNITWKEDRLAEGVLWWGQRGRRFAGATMEPVWLTGEEATTLGRYAQFDAQAAYKGTSWTHEDLPQGWTLGEDDVLAPHAQMPGLLGWAAWQAAASPTRDPSRRHKHQVTARAVWWRAAERQRAFEAAWVLHHAGYSVLSHGRGQVAVAIDPGLPTVDLARAVLRAGLILPRVLAQALPLDAAADRDDPVHVAHWLRRLGDPELLADLDRLVAPWPGPSAEIKTVLATSGQRLQRLKDDPQIPDDWRGWWEEQLQNQARVSVDRVKRLARRRQG